MISYTFTKSKDSYTLIVEETCTYKLQYLSAGSVETITKSEELVAGVTKNIPILKDGLYKIILNEDLVDITEKEFFVMKFLQEDVIKSIQNILCNDCIETSSLCDDTTGLSKKEELLLLNQSIFNNILVYQNYYLAQYENEYLSYFSNYLESTTNLVKVKTQKNINTSVFTKIIKGKDSYNQDLLRISLFIYWAGFYFTEKFFLEDAENEEELVYLSEKFKVDVISACVEDLTINLEQLEAAYNNNLDKVNIYHHQLDFIGQGINDLLEIENYINAYTQAEMLDGIDITFTNIAKFAFIVKGASKNTYKIIDTLGNNITNSFDYYFIDNVSYYLSKENVSHSTVSFKFQKK